MPPGSGLALGAIVVMALVSWVLRMAGGLIMTRVRVTPAVEAFLQHMATSVLVAIVATAVLSGGSRTGAAVAIAALFMLLTKSAVVAMLAGMGAAALWTATLL